MGHGQLKEEHIVYSRLDNPSDIQHLLAKSEGWKATFLSFKMREWGGRVNIADEESEWSNNDLDGKSEADTMRLASDKRSCSRSLPRQALFRKVAFESSASFPWPHQCDGVTKSQPSPGVITDTTEPLPPDETEKRVVFSRGSQPEPWRRRTSCGPPSVTEEWLRDSRELLHPPSASPWDIYFPPWTKAWLSPILPSS